jgi:hypothetical protein
VYGANIDAHTYLQKFINIETTIPKRVSDRYGNDLASYSNKLIQLHELETWGDNRNILECLNVLSRHFNLSLRQLEKVFTNLAIFYSTSEENHLRLVPIITFISVIKVIKPSTFNKLLLGQISYEKLCNEIGVGELSEEKESERKLWWLMNWVRFSLLTESEFNEVDASDHIRQFGQTLWRYNVDRERLLPLFCQKLSMFIVN